jgi:hypothetical protein
MFNGTDMSETDKSNSACIFLLRYLGKKRGDMLQPEWSQVIRWENSQLW